MSIFPVNFMKSFGFEGQEFDYNINSLEDIGWIDKFREAPLPMKMVEPETLVYSESRFEEDYIPRIIFIPSFKIMFTIMRHCIGTQNVDDLWFVLEKAKLPTVDKNIAGLIEATELSSPAEKSIADD